MSILDSFRIDDQVAVVTGSGQGIGRAIAWALADAGADVVLNARRISDLDITAAGVRDRGRRALIVDGDIRDFSDTVAERTIAEFGRLDIWVNNVGGSDEKDVHLLVDTS
ncbi:MAG: SDR family NAD(P)-dependent oxidoreductase, partial [Actinomycetota bacterium]|nr:SDR family NAD(P)-dependent oxidoreductase [Actinomycetota bacterium]